MRSIKGSSQCKHILINQSMFRTHSQFQFTTKSRIEYMRKEFPPMMKKSVTIQFLTTQTQQQALWSLMMLLLSHLLKIKLHQVWQTSKHWYQRNSICLMLNWKNLSSLVTWTNIEPDLMTSRETHSLTQEISSRTWREAMNSMSWNSVREKDRLKAYSVSILIIPGRVNLELTSDIYLLLIGLSSLMLSTWLLTTSGKTFMQTLLESIFIILSMRANFKLIKN